MSAAELCSPTAAPRVRRTTFSSESSSLVIGRSNYRLMFATKVALATSPRHGAAISKVSRYIPDFSSKPGFTLQKTYDSGDDSSFGGPVKKAKMSVMGSSASAPSKNVSQFVALTPEMTAAIFNPVFVASLKSFIEEENEAWTGVDADGQVEERLADKPAIRIPPPVTAGAKKSGLGTLSVGVVVSNYNLVKHAVNDEEFAFENEDGSSSPQLLCQITMTDTKADPAGPPLVRFSAPSSHMLKILEDEKFLQLIRSRCPTFPGSEPADSD